MFSFFHNELWPDIDDHATNGSGRLDCQVQILYFLVSVGGFHVDSLRGNRRNFAIIHGFIDKLTGVNKNLPKYDSVMHCIKDVVGGDGENVLDIWVIFQDLVDMVCEGIPFRVQDGMDDGF